MFQERILEIIIYILNELKERKDFKDIDFKRLNKFGYTDSEINTAIVWIYSKIHEDEQLFIKNLKSLKSIRILNRMEQRIFSPDAHGYLISMRELGLISEQDFEYMIDKLTSSGVSRIGLAELKSILSSLILNIDDPNDKRNRFLLNNNDTIN